MIVWRIACIALVDTRPTCFAWTRPNIETVYTCATRVDGRPSVKGARARSRTSRRNVQTWTILVTDARGFNFQVSLWSARFIVSAVEKWFTSNEIAILPPRRGSDGRTVAICTKNIIGRKNEHPVYAQR